MPSQHHGRKVAALITALSCLLGIGAATLAAQALAASAPDDAKAATTGHETSVKPAEIIGYGG
ncbi:hypothetical protein [Arsenicicoccus sp. oral taxon 190]|uniref:hypothetical protein n=1 Tax=Arsenicicoccus sp. oral taxon 190 TaxID=1658671 RepID=UPI00067A1440|nr:hypothetical protein [Arsenicicoccus sp. oral taxon 190]AKT50758.1 hypothetical protein ADJ73_04545 [Arsenicicoccus sp. oral taxon 190]